MSQLWIEMCNVILFNILTVWAAISWQLYDKGSAQQDSHNPKNGMGVWGFFWLVDWFWDYYSFTYLFTPLLSYFFAQQCKKTRTRTSNCKVGAQHQVHTSACMKPSSAHQDNNYIPPHNPSQCPLSELAAGLCFFPFWYIFHIHSNEDKHWGTLGVKKQSCTECLDEFSQPLICNRTEKNRIEHFSWKGPATII